MAETRGVRVDVDLIDELKDMRTSRLETLSDVIWYLKKKHDGKKRLYPKKIQDD